MTYDFCKCLQYHVTYEGASVSICACPTLAVDKHFVGFGVEGCGRKQVTVSSMKIEIGVFRIEYAALPTSTCMNVNSRHMTCDYATNRTSLQFVGDDARERTMLYVRFPSRSM
jgi:hypothetical protein